MPTFYDLKKYAATGIASSDMTQYDKLKALAMFGGGFPVSTISGIPPLSFKSDGTPLISWSMKGNGSQTGTPTPDNPVMPEFVGVRTGNLFDDDNAELGKWVNSDGLIVTNAAYAAGYDITVGTASEFAIKYHGDKPYSYGMAFYDSNGDFLSRSHRSSPSTSYDAFSVPENAVSARFQVAVDTREVMTSAILKAMKLMLNSGSTALPYEPYGYKIPISCAGQTVPVYLGQTQTVRRVKKLVLTGNNPSAWTMTEQQQTGRRRVYLGSAVSEGENIGFICTHYAAASPNTAYPNNGYFSINSSGTLIFGIANDGTKDEFVQFLASEYAAGTPVTIWYALAEQTTGIVNEPLCKIGTYADELSSEDAGVTIPTAKGANALTVDTDLQPSEVSITGHIKAN